MSRPRTLLGAVSAAVQVASSAVVLIFVYRFVTAAVGLEYFGVWSGVMAASALANLGECGLGGAALRFVARSRALRQTRRTALVIETTVATTVAIATATSLAVWPLAHLGLASVFEGQPSRYLEAARAVLPMVLMVPVMTAISNVVLSSLDGMEQVHERTLVAFAGSVVLAASAWVFVPHLGLAGLALAQIAQAATSALLGWARLHRHVSALAWVPRRWVRSIATESLRFGLGWQAVGWANLLMDPLAKILAIRFGGVAFAGHFEFALRVAPQVRSVVSSAQQALMPLLTRLSARDEGRLRDIYALSMRVTLSLVLLAQPFLYVGSAVIAWIWVNEHDTAVVDLLRVVLMLGFLNLLGNPAYFESAGRGNLRPNIATHLAMAALNAVLAWTLGRAWGGHGVALGYAGALAGGALLLAGWHGWHRRVSVSEWIRGPELITAIVAVIGTVLAAMALGGPRPIAATGAALLLTVLAGLGVLWAHPLRRAVHA